MANEITVKHEWNGAKIISIKAMGDKAHQFIEEHSAIFSDILMYMSNLESGCTRLGKAWSERKYEGGKEELKQAKKGLVTLLNIIAGEVDIVADGDAKIILLAGMVPSYMGKQKAHRPDQPDTPKGKSFPGGKITMRVVPVEGAKMYCWVIFTKGVFKLVIEKDHIFLPPNSGCIIIPYGGSIETLYNIPKMIEVNIGVMAVNSAGISVLSNLFTLGTQ